MLLFLFLLVSQHTMVTATSSCQSDMNADHRPRVSCVSQGLAAVPDGIDSGTQVLVFSQNVFVSLSWAAYTNFTQLHELDLSQNLISTIDRSGPVLEKVQVLRLSNNSLTGLGRAAFNSTPSLMEVYLDGNNISSLDSATFSDLPNLEVINLLGNKLHVLPADLLEHISSIKLKNFNLQNNHIQHLPDKFFASKHELPYVFLSNNSWVCTCQVSYLHQFLDDQSHNIYIQISSSVIQNDPYTVVCSAPLTLLGRAIIELEEEEYCGSLTSDTTQLMSTISTRKIIPVEIITTTQSTTEPNTTPILTTPITSTPITTKPATTEKMIPSTTPTTILTTTQSTAVSSTTFIVTTPTTDKPTTPATTEKMIPSTTPTTILTTTPSTAVSSTTFIVTTPTTDKPTTPATTAKMIPATTTILTTTQSTAASSSTFIATTPTTDKPTTPATTEKMIPSTTPTTILTTTPSTAVSSTTSILTTTTKISTSATTKGIIPSTTTSTSSTTSILTTPTTIDLTFITAVSMVPPPAGGVLSAHRVGQRSVAWCWWLFITVLLLCIFSAIFSCMLVIWLVIIYITLYRPIKQQVLNNQGVTLKTYQVTSDDLGTVDTTEEERVKFLPLDMIQEIQPVFRSVLFISKEAKDDHEDVRIEGRRNEDEEKKRGTDAATKIDLLPAVTMHREQETESNGRQGVFRKTLFRVISQEEEIEDWKEVEESCWGMTERDRGRREGGAERQKKRYSLILREERESVMEGRKGENEWLVGEWETKGEQEIWESLIRMKEGSSLSDSTHMDPPKPVAETSV